MTIAHRLVILGFIAILRLFDGESAAQPTTLPTPEPTLTPATTSIEGVATWYDYKSRQAAAGPALRALLGKNWRGKTVVVSHDNRHINVVLTDWCQCEFRMPGERLIDLDYHDFAKLGSPSRGILKVTVSTVSETVGR